MRILILSQYFWPENFRINDLAKGLKDRGHEVEVLTGLPNYPAGKIFEGYGWKSQRTEIFEGSIKVHRVPLIPRGRGRGLELFLNYISFALSASLLGPWRCRRSYDVIFVFEPSPITVGIPALVLKYLKGIPIVFWVQDLWPESLSATGAIRASWALKVVKSFVRFLYRHCDRVLVQSQSFIEKVIAIGAEPKSTFYFPNWAESFYQPVSEVRSAVISSDQPFRLVFAGNIGAAQSFSTILGAAEQLKGLKDLHWIIYGDGRERPWMQEQIQKRGLAETVQWMGFQPPEKMPEIFSKADALLVTLRRDPIFAMTIPSKVQSYLACGKPILASLEGEGARVIEESGAGFVTEPENAESLAQLAERFYKMSAFERAQMGSAGRAYFEKNFEREKLITQLEEWLCEF